MSVISIGDLQPSGMELFTDSESYFSYLSEDEELNVLGGKTPSTTIMTSSPGCMVGSLVLTVIGSIAYSVLKKA